jgi:hypothetical protein
MQGLSGVVLLTEDLREHVGEDAAGAVVVFFDRRVDADGDGDFEAIAAGGVDAEGGGLLRFLIGICFLREAPETAVGPDRRRG